jgi:hypothetical protein
MINYSQEHKSPVEASLCEGDGLLLGDGVGGLPNQIASSHHFSHTKRPLLTIDSQLALL